MNYNIDKNIPHPNFNRVKYPFKDMEVGDSFFVPLDGVDALTIKNRLNCAVRDNSLKLSFKFAQKRENNGYRVWRIS
jgi:hypothetical protein